jgi:hypothetical protein
MGKYVNVFIVSDPEGYLQDFTKVDEWTDVKETRPENPGVILEAEFNHSRFTMFAVLIRGHAWPRHSLSG